MKILLWSIALLGVACGCEDSRPTAEQLCESRIEHEVMATQARERVECNRKLAPEAPQLRHVTPQDYQATAFNRLIDAQAAVMASCEATRKACVK